MSAPALDKFDRMILVLLQRDNLITTEKLGESVGLSSSAVQRRIKRLRESGVIVRDSAVLDAKAVGRPLTVIVAVAVERETNEVVEAFRRRALAADEVQQCYYVTGEGDFLLVITARSMDEYQDIARRLFLEDPNVRHFSTSVVIEPLKTTLDVPLP